MNRNAPAATGGRWTAIRRTFRSYFQTWKLRLPRSLGPGVGTLTCGGWYIRWCTGERHGRPYLDFYAAHRMTNHRHHRVFADGRLGHLPAESDLLLLPAGASPSEEERIRGRARRRNGRIAELVRRKFESRAGTSGKDGPLDRPPRDDAHRPGTTVLG